MPLKRKYNSLMRRYRSKRRRTMSYLPRTRGRITGFYNSGLPSYNYGASRVVSIPGKDFMPERLRTKFNYIETINYSTAAVPAGQVWRGNSGFDPNQTGTGSQPVGWDNMNDFYTYVNIYASSINVEVTSLDDTSFYIYILPYASATYPTSSTVNVEAIPHCKKIFVPNSSNGGHAIGNNFAQNKSIVAITSMSSDFTSTFLANPGVQWFWHVYVVSADTGTTFTGSIKTRITYYCILSGRKIVALST